MAQAYRPALLPLSYENVGEKATGLLAEIAPLAISEFLENAISRCASAPGRRDCADDTMGAGMPAEYAAPRRRQKKRFSATTPDDRS